MAFEVEHIHVKGPDPRKTAQWYVDIFDAKVVKEWEIEGALFVRVDIGGVGLNISNARTGEQLGPGDATPHYGLEHFGLATDNLEEVMTRLEERGTEVFVPLRSGAMGTKIAFIRAPDDVRIELIQWGKERPF